MCVREKDLSRCFFASFFSAQRLTATIRTAGSRRRARHTVSQCCFDGCSVRKLLRARLHAKLLAVSRSNDARLMRSFRPDADRSSVLFSFSEIGDSDGTAARFPVGFERSVAGKENRPTHAAYLNKNGISVPVVHHL